MFETKKQLKEIINQLNSKIRELKDYSSDYSKLFMEATRLNKDYYYLKEEKDELDKQNATLEIINLKLKSQLDELVDSRIKSSLRIVARCQKLSSENKALKEENETLKSKELKDTEKICDGINSELLNLCTKLSDENLLLIHKQPIIRESKSQQKEEKRDKYGVVSEAIDAETSCNICVYSGMPSSKDPCNTCGFRLEDNEYYSSK